MNTVNFRHTTVLLSFIVATQNLVASDKQPVTTVTNSNLVWTVDDLMSAEWSGDWNISPDCRWAVWVKTVPDQDKGEYVGNLFLSSLTDDAQVQLTRGNEDCNSPKWSPDGKMIAFLSSRPNPKAKADDKGKTQVWLMNPFGGEPWPLTSGDRSIDDFEWSGPDEVIYSAKEEPSDYEKANKDKKDATQVVEDDEHEPPVRLFKINVNSTNATVLTTNVDRIQVFCLSPDKTEVVTLHSRSLRDLYDRSVRPVIFITNLKTGERKQIFGEAQYYLRWPVCWQRDSRGFFAVNARTSNPKYDYPAVLELYHFDLTSGAIEKIDLDWERGLESADVQATADGFVALLADGAQPKLARFSQTGDQWRRDWVTGTDATNVWGFKIGKDNKTFLYDRTTLSRPDQWCRATLDQAKIESPVQLTSLNPGFEKKQTARCEVVHWKGALDETVEGLLYYPFDYKPGKKYPLVVDIHGGPAWLFEERWWGYPIYNNNLLNCRGAFVFRPNYHGSSGYGLEWAESNIGRLGDLEVEDINKGVDYLIARGLADPERLAVMGWSNGGALTAAITVATNRFKAAVACDGPIESINYWAQSDIGAWFCGSYFGKTPLDDPATLMRQSPFYQMSRVTTPTLIIFGAEDNRVPVAQGWMHYRALQQTGKTSVRFIIFPGEGHGPSKLVYLERALDEELGWFNKYLFAN